jgi:hypothetical protein
MAWLWWLLAPLVSTVLGASVLLARASREPGTSGRARDAMGEHRRLMAALGEPSEPAPLTMRVLPYEDDRSALSQG